MDELPLMTFWEGHKDKYKLTNAQRQVRFWDVCQGNDVRPDESTGLRCKGDDVGMQTVSAVSFDFVSHLSQEKLKK